MLQIKEKTEYLFFLFFKFLREIDSNLERDWERKIMGKKKRINEFCIKDFKFFIYITFFKIKPNWKNKKNWENGGALQCT